jgi:hypothetical protein
VENRRIEIGAINKDLREEKVEILSVEQKEKRTLS